MVTLAGILLETLAISLLFAGAGSRLRRLAWREASPVEPALAWGQGYFVGLTAFLAISVPLSRLVGARAAAASAGALILVACALEARAIRADFRRHLRVLASLVVLVAGFTVVDLALWLPTIIDMEPAALEHIGSIHSGRYANYAWFIAEFDRVPFLAQDGAGPMLASLNLILGSRAVLAALMSWIPVSLAFFGLLLHGWFRGAGRGPASCAAAVFLVLFCNIAVSLVHVMVFDNGSPLAFIGYADLVIAAATFVLMAAWLRRWLDEGLAGARLPWIMPFVLALTWAWYAPHNLVVALFGFVPAVAMHARREGPRAAIRKPVAYAGVVLAGALAGAVQFGPLLPPALQEETGLWVQPVHGGDLSLRPYGLWLRSHWTGSHWNIPVDAAARTNVYEKTLENAREVGPAEAFRDVQWLIEEQLWESLRIYGFPLLGLAGFAWSLRRRRNPAQGERSDRAWLSLAAWSFACGFAVYFSFELMHIKWWLTRFLVPGTTLALTCLALASLEGIGRLQSPAKRATAWTLLLAVATLGPMFELVDMIGRKASLGINGAVAGPVAAMVDARAPFLLETIERHAPLATGFRRIVVGPKPGTGNGIALETPALPARAGRYRGSMRIAMDAAQAPSTPLLELEAWADGKLVARRSLDAGALSSRQGSHWADLDFALAENAHAMRLKLITESATPFVVSDVGLRRVAGD